MGQVVYLHSLSGFSTMRRYITKLNWLRIPEFIILEAPARVEYARFVKLVFYYNMGRKDLMNENTVNSAWAEVVHKQLDIPRRHHWMKQVRRYQDVTYHRAMLIVSSNHRAPLHTFVMRKSGEGYPRERKLKRDWKVSSEREHMFIYHWRPTQTQTVTGNEKRRLSTDLQILYLWHGPY